MQIVTQIKRNQHSSGRRVKRDIISGIIQELRSGVPLNIVRIIITPPELHIYPKLATSGTVERVLIIVQQGGFTHLPFESRKQQDVCTGGIHFVGFTRVDAFVLNCGISKGFIRFLPVSISRASSSRSNTWHKSITTDSWIFCQRCALNI